TDRRGLGPRPQVLLPVAEVRGVGRLQHAGAGIWHPRLRAPGAPADLAHRPGAEGTWAVPRSMSAARAQSMPPTTRRRPRRVPAGLASRPADLGKPPPGLVFLRVCGLSRGESADRQILKGAGLGVGLAVEDREGGVLRVGDRREAPGA